MAQLPTKMDAVLINLGAPTGEDPPTAFVPSYVEAWAELPVMFAARSLSENVLEKLQITAPGRYRIMAVKAQFSSPAQVQRGFYFTLAVTERREVVTHLQAADAY